MAIHGNSNSNLKPHHLYEIRDSVDDEVFKYGISHEAIEDDGLSNRPRLQINFLNLGVKWLRFFANILVINIPGKKKPNALNDTIFALINCCMAKNREAILKNN
jgi:URI fold toxin 2